MRGFFASSEIQVEAPIGSIPKCGSCGLLKTCRSPKMQVAGDGRNQVLIVGEAPGATEDQEGKPFVGTAGQHLRSVLGSLGVRLDKDAWTTNALICRPPDNVIRDPRMIDYCRPNLVQTIETYAPRVIVVLGKSALASVLRPYWKSDMRTLDRWVGWKIPLEKHWVVPTYHPSFLLRMKNDLMNRLFSEHLELAFNIKTLPPKQPDWQSQIELLYDEAKICESIQALDKAGGFCAIDYETNCLKPEYQKAKIYSCSMSNGQRTISYPWRGRAIEVTGEFLRSKRTRKIAANLKMEERWTRKVFGHGVRRWGWDTMLATHCLDNRPDICSLKFQAMVKLGVPLYSTSIEPYLKSKKEHYNRIQEIETGQLLTYGGMDSLLEWHLAMVQRKEMGHAD